MRSNTLRVQPNSHRVSFIASTNLQNMLIPSHDIIQACVVSAIFVLFVSLCDRRKVSCSKRRRPAPLPDDDTYNDSGVPQYEMSKWGMVWYAIVFVVTCVIVLVMLGTFKIGLPWWWSKVAGKTVASVASKPSFAHSGGGGIDDGVGVVDTGSGASLRDVVAPSSTWSASQSVQRPNYARDRKSLMASLAPFVDKTLFEQVVSNIDTNDASF